jgi:O-antigen ligase
MIKASIKNKKTTHFALVLAFGLMGIFPLIPEKFEGVVVISFLAVSLALFLFNPKDRGILKTDFFITSALFFLFLISALLSNDISEGFKKIETMLSLLLFPLVFFIFLGGSKLDYSKYKHIFFKTFFISNVLFSLLSFYLFSIYSSPKFSIKDASFFRSAVSDIPLIGDHPTYISIFLSIAILIGITFYNFRKQRILYNILIAVGHLILTTLLILLMSKGVLIALFIALCILLRRKIKRIYIFSILILLLLGLVIPSANNRFKELLNNETYNTLNSENSTSIRVNILKCNYELIVNKPILGYGLGDVQGALDKCYSKKNYGFKIRKYNSHNQYVFIWLSVGLIGIFIFIFTIFYYFKTAWINEDYLMLSIIIFYSVVFLFENVLSRQSGVILFAFIINFMILDKISTKNFSEK